MIKVITRMNGRIEQQSPLVVSVVCSLVADSKDEVVALPEFVTGEDIIGLRSDVTYKLALGTTCKTAEQQYGTIDSYGFWHFSGEVIPQEESPSPSLQIDLFANDSSTPPPWEAALNVAGWNLHVRWSDGVDMDYHNYIGFSSELRESYDQNGYVYICKLYDETPVLYPWGYEEDARYAFKVKYDESGKYVVEQDSGSKAIAEASLINEG